MFNRLGETNEVQSFVLSLIKRISALDVKGDSSLKVKRRNLVITSCEASSNSKGKIKDEKQVSSNHVTIREVDDLGAKVEPAEAPKHHRRWEASHSDELKELNLIMKEDPHLIYLSSLHTSEEEK